MPDETQPIPSAPAIGRSVWTAMLVLALGGLGVSLFLWYVTFNGAGISGCGGPESSGGFIDCNHVLASRYSRFFTLPVATPAAMVYAAITALLVRIGPRATPEALRRVYPLLLMLCGAAAAAAIWFIALQAFEFKAICVYCMSAHLCSLGLLGLMLRQAPFRRGPSDGTSIPTKMSVISVAIFTLLGATSAAFLPLGIAPPIKVTTEAFVRPNVSTGYSNTRTVTMLNAAFSVRPAELPLLGLPDADVIVIDMFDYTCPHCRMMHQYLKAARSRYGNQIAVIPLAVPMDSECNPRWTDTQEIHKDSCKLAKLGLAVWRARPEAMEQFDEWMFEPESPRSLNDARAYAANLVGGEEVLAKALQDPWIDTRIQSNIDIFGIAHGGAVPKLVFGNVIVGQVASVEYLFKVFEKDTTMKSVAGAETQPGR